MYSASESEFVDLHQIDPAVLYGFLNGPGEGWVPFSDLFSQQLWALGLGEEKGKVLCCCLFLREQRLFCLCCIVPGLKTGVADKGIEWGALHFARGEYEWGEYELPKLRVMFLTRHYTDCDRNGCSGFSWLHLFCPSSLKNAIPWP